MRFKTCRCLSELEDCILAAKDKLVIIELFDKKSRPLTMELEKVARSQRSVIFLQIHIVDFDPGVATLITQMQHSFRAMPMFIMVKSLKIVDEVLGAKFKELKEAIAKHNKPKPFKRQADSEKKVERGSKKRKCKKSQKLPFVRF